MECWLLALPPNFKMPDIDHYMGIGCPRIHLRFYSAVIRAYGLDEMQMIMHFPLSLSGAMYPCPSTCLLGRPWIYEARVISSSLHQKVKFIHDGQVITICSFHYAAISSKHILEISHSDEDLFLTGFTFDEVQTIKMFDDLARDYLSLPFDEFGSKVMIGMIQSMDYFALFRARQEAV
ncbi:hypothetical protein CK203_049445 [Vitis vinifera]|uniref:Uncharacterized protein n=1 Tax=Vitis vinifera TaxID=29760 RepID=A0A438HAW4_VITVI|nr:hypothetical protein CK203_049445 [Vitis vinifera]